MQLTARAGVRGYGGSQDMQGDAGFLNLSVPSDERVVHVQFKVQACEIAYPAQDAAIFEVRGRSQGRTDC